MTEPTQTELNQKLTAALGRKVPGCWVKVRCTTSDEDMRDFSGLDWFWAEGGVLLTQPDTIKWTMEPTLSQLLQLIEVEGYWFECGKDTDGYYCRILRLPDGFTIYVEWERFFGLTLEYAATLAAIAVLTRKEKT